MPKLIDSSIEAAKSAARRLLGQQRYKNLQDIVHNAAMAIAPDTAVLADKAQLAWDEGRGVEAERRWRHLSVLQPQQSDWPIKLAFAAEMRADDLDAERILQKAVDRGIQSPDIEERLAFYRRWNRNSNAAEEEAVAIVDDATMGPVAVSRAVSYLLAMNNLPAARRGVERIVAAKPGDSALRSQQAALMLLERAAGAGRPTVPGWLSPARDAIAIREPGADTTVIAFTTVRGDLGMPVNAVHALLPPKTNAIYLFDEKKFFSLDGSAAYGRPYPEMLGGLRKQLEAWGTRTLIMLGFSAGGFTALRVGLDLKAQGAFLLSPITTLHRPPEAPIVKGAKIDMRAAFLETRMRSMIPGIMTNLHDELVARTCMPRLDLYYSQNFVDAVHANRIANTPGLNLHMVEGFTGHEPLSELVRRGQDGLIARYIEDVRAGLH